MGIQEDHHDAHVKNLRLLLGSILTPKRHPYAHHSTSTSGTASPAFHSLSSSAPSTPDLSGRHHHGRMEPSPMSMSSTRATVSRATSDTTVPVLSSLHPLAESNDAPLSARSAPPPVNAGEGGAQSRSDFLGTLQSKRAWDALIHGSFV